MGQMKSFAAILVLALPLGAQGPVGLFESNSVTPSGKAVFDAATKTYTLSADGASHYVWQKISGDISITADIKFLSTVGDPHKKAALLIRQSLDADSAYAEVAVQGDGLTSLQTRDARGGGTHEIQTTVSRPSSVSITKDGDNFYVSVGTSNEPLHFAGGVLRVPLTDPYYVGLAVYAEATASFSNVDITALRANTPKRRYSTLETMNVDSAVRRAVYVTEDPLTNPPSWSPDGSVLTFFNGGRDFAVPATGGPLTDQGRASSRIETELESPSPDGRHIVSLWTESKDAQLQLRNADETNVTTLAQFPDGATAAAWSPDGRQVAFISYQSIR